MKKGQVVPEEVKCKMILSKQKRLLAQYDWSLIDKWLDTEFTISQRNKKTKFITFRQFKHFLQSGKNLRQITKMGYSRHMLVFMSNFAKNRIKLDKAQFEADYLSGMSLDDIAIKHRLPREYVTFLREMYQCKAKGATYMRRKSTEIPITTRQQEIIFGTLLGDASKMSPSSLKIKHGTHQKEYVIWKFKELESIASKNSLVFHPYVTKNGNDALECRFYTHANSDVEQIISMFYKNGRKIVSQEILDQVTPLALAVWFQDDGSSYFRNNISTTRSKVTDESTLTKGWHGEHQNICSYNPEVHICTDSFSIAECQLIISWLDNRYGIKASIKNSKEHPRIKIVPQNVLRFFDLIRPYMIPMFSYKIDPMARKVYKKNKRSRIELPILIDKLSRMPHGNEYLRLNILEQDKIINESVDMLRKIGFSNILPQPHANHRDLENAKSCNIQNLILHDNEIRFHSSGSRFMLSHFHGFWSTRAKGRKSPKDIFENDRYLSEIVREILSQRELNLRRVLSATRNYRGNKIISAFMPCVARAIYERYAPERAKVLDFCAGYGGRLMGAMLSDKVHEYQGIEPCFDSYTGLLSLRDSIKAVLNVKKQVSIYNQKAPDAIRQFDDDEFDFCLTSPPYFDVEEYSEDASQSWIRHPRYSEWFQEFLLPSIKESLRVSRITAINMANTGSYRIADDLRSSMPSFCRLISEDRIRYPKFGGSFKYEQLFVMTKR